MSNPVQDTWLSCIEQRLPRTLEVDPRLGLRLVCGTDQAGQPIFCSISSLKPGIPELSDAVDLTRMRRTIDGHWVLLLTLKDSRFTDVFVQLCGHIVDRVSATTSEAQGLSAFMSGVEEWRTILQASPSQRLSPEATRGLFGELWLGFHHLVQECPTGHVMDAWRGPFRSDQDFQFPGGPLIEVKTVHSQSRRIQISSENQLTPPANRCLFVGVVTVDDAMADTPGAITVPALLDQTDTLLQEADVPLSDLNRRLAELRFDRADDFYADLYFLPVSVRYLQVTESFPRIAPSMLTPSISNVSYSLNLEDLSPFEVDPLDLGIPTAKPKASSNDS